MYLRKDGPGSFGCCSVRLSAPNYDARSEKQCVLLPDAPRTRDRPLVGGLHFLLVIMALFQRADT
jgi:hypothetical protein